LGKNLKTSVPLHVRDSKLFGLILGYLIITILLVSLIVTLYSDKGSLKRKPDLLKIGFINRMVKSRKFQFLTQLPMVFLYFLLILAGVYGTSNPSKNISTVGLWTIWWILIIFAILFVGKLWCLMCPIAAVGDWIQRGSFYKKENKGISLNRKWPKRFRNLYIATAFFVVLTWFELGSSITFNPLHTAYLLIFMLLAAIISAVVFERRSFCRYACFIGRVSGLYAMIAPTDLRASNKEVCKQCKTKDCLTGNTKGYGCPMFEYPGKMDKNTYCILCTECIKTCPKNNISFNLRPFAKDLISFKKARKDEAYLALIMLSMTLFHTITMTSLWDRFITIIKKSTGIDNSYVLFTLGMSLFTLIPVGIYYIASGITRVISGNQNITLKSLFLNYAYALLPLALFMHLAHNSMHLFREFHNIVPVLSDPFGWNISGISSIGTNPILTLSDIRIIQLLLVGVGLIYSIFIALKISNIIFDQKEEVIKASAMVIIILIIFSITGVYFMTQPMIMRTI